MSLAIVTHVNILRGYGLVGSLLTVNGTFRLRAITPSSTHIRFSSSKLSTNVVIIPLVFSLFFSVL